MQRKRRRGSPSSSPPPSRRRGRRRRPCRRPSERWPVGGWTDERTDGRTMDGRMDGFDWLFVSIRKPSASISECRWVLPYSLDRRREQALFTQQSKGVSRSRAFIFVAIGYMWAGEMAAKSSFPIELPFPKGRLVATYGAGVVGGVVKVGRREDRCVEGTRFRRHLGGSSFRDGKRV